MVDTASEDARCTSRIFDRMSWFVGSGLALLPVESQISGLAFSTSASANGLSSGRLERETERETETPHASCPSRNRDRDDVIRDIPHVQGQV